MTKLNKLLVNLVSSIEIVEYSLFHKVNSLLKALRLKAFNLPGIVQYKSLGSLRLLREISTILDSLDTTYFIVGGFAYDIKRGRVSRYHADLDFAVLCSDISINVEDCFKRHGFTLINGGTDLHLVKDGRYVDIFFWFKTDDGHVSARSGDKIVRMPADWFSYEIKCLYGNQYRVASDEYIICIEPFVTKVHSKQYISGLKQQSQIIYKHGKTTVAQSVDIYEFTNRQESKVNIIPTGKTKDNHIFIS